MLALQALLKIAFHNHYYHKLFVSLKNRHIKADIATTAMFVQMLSCSRSAFSISPRVRAFATHFTLNGSGFSHETDSLKTILF